MIRASFKEFEESFEGGVVLWGYLEEQDLDGGEGFEDIEEGYKVVND